MREPSNENLRELLAKFMDEGAAGRAAEDIERGDELLRKWSAPQPSEAALAEVKRKMAIALRRRRAITSQRRITAAAAVAAVLVVVSAVALRLFERRPMERTVATIPERIWESSDIAADDADITVLAAEIDTIENELSGVELYDNGGNGAVGDFEMELIETSGDFWKG
jgi:hypothetical protein